MKERIKKAKEYLTRVFSCEDFEDAKKVTEILKEVCFHKTKLVSKKISFELRPCYEAPLLTAEQEQHLFRKMNYFKYKAKKLLNKEEVSKKCLEKVEDLIDKSKFVRNQIAESNFRLATQLLKQNINFYREHSLIDSLLSDAYCDIIKAVDYFDWTRGHKFSTYATWVLKKNFFRDSKDKQRKAEKLVRLQDSEVGKSVESKASNRQEELEYESQKKLVQSLLVLLKHGDCADDQSRQVYILENYFGLNGNDGHTLEEISQKLHITKERVRQIKEKSLDWLRIKVKELNLNYETVIDSFSWS